MRITMIIAAALTLSTSAAADNSPFSATDMTRLATEMRAFVDQGRRAGVVYGIMHRGKLAALEAYGKRDIENNLPMTVDTSFRLYSQSRAVTAAAILTLVDDGKLALDDKVATYIPAVGRMQVVKQINGDDVTVEPQTTPMTVRHLFTYTAGLGYAYDWPKNFGLQQRAVMALDGTIADSVSRLTAAPLLDQPGSAWRYGFSSDVLGRVAEVASGQPFDVILRKRLLEKLGMRDTGFWTKDAGKLAVVYEPAGPRKLKVKAPVPSSTYTTPATLFSAGGGLVSTAGDYLRFLQMLLNGGTLDGARVLNPETVKMMLSRQTTPEQGLVYWYSHGQGLTWRGYAWGLGIAVRAAEGPHTVPGSPGDAGWAGLANTYYFIDPKEELAAVVMSQYEGDDADALPLAFRQAVYDALRP